MNDLLDQTLHEYAGVARKRDLVHGGVSARVIAQAVADGRLIRVRQGTYASPLVDPSIIRAVRVGGALAGESATRLLGLWTPPNATLTISLPRHATRPRDPSRSTKLLSPKDPRVRLRYDGNRLDPVRERLIVGVTRCVIQCVDSLEPHLALAVLDSSLRLPGSTRPLIRDLAAELPSRCSAVLEVADDRAESGTESVMRWHLLQMPVRFEIQKWVTPAIRVDFLIEGFLVVECTSYEFHGSPESYRRDRRRAAEIVRHGYVLIEVCYEQVLFDWPTTEATLLAALVHR